MMRALSNLALLLALAAPALLVLPSCDSKPDAPAITNPFDPDNGATGGNALAPAAEYDPEGLVEITWTAQPTLASVIVYRRSEGEAAFSVLDTVPVSDGTYIDNGPAFFSTNTYRVAGLAPGGAVSDTAGRGELIVETPPVVFFGDGTGIAKQRDFVIDFDAGPADSMRFSVNAPLTGAPWTPITGAVEYELPAGPDTTAFAIQFRRLVNGVPVESDSFGDTVRPVRTRGTIEIAGGATTVARRELSVALTGGYVRQIVLSEDDQVFGDAGDSVITIDSIVSSNPLTVTWRFPATPGEKTLYARFATDFMVDTTAADTVSADDLTAVSARLANSDTTFDCANPITLSAVATQMNLKKGFPSNGWEPYREDAIWVIEDTTAGTQIVEVLFANDFVNPGPVPARDTTELALRPLGVVVDDPADSTEFAPGDSVSIGGSVIPASCTAAPESVTVFVDDVQIARVPASPSWDTFVFLDTAFADTTAVTIRAETADEEGGAAADTVSITVIP